MRLRDLLPKELLIEDAREWKNIMDGIKKFEKMASDASRVISKTKSSFPRGTGHGRDDIEKALQELDDLMDDVTLLAERIYIEVKAEYKQTPLGPGMKGAHGIGGTTGRKTFTRK